MLFLLFLAGMVIAYTAVRLITKHREPTVPPRGSVAEARELRECSNALLQLLDRYVDEFPASGVPTASAKRWLAQEFRPALFAVEARLASAGAESPVIQELQAVVPLAIAMAASPRDGVLRGRVLQMAVTAAAAAESWIKENGADQLLGIPRYRALFVRDLVRRMGDPGQNRAIPERLAAAELTGQIYVTRAGCGTCTSLG